MSPPARRRRPDAGVRRGAGPAHTIRVNSVHPTHVATDMLHNEGTFKMFRPDLENRAPMTWRPSAVPHAADPVGGSPRHQQRRVVLRVRRVALRRRCDAARRRRQLPEVAPRGPLQVPSARRACWYATHRCRTYRCARSSAYRVPPSPPGSLGTLTAREPHRAEEILN